MQKSLTPVFSREAEHLTTDIYVVQYFVMIVRAMLIVQRYLQDKCGQHENNSTKAMYLDRLGHLLNNLKTSSKHTVEYQQAFIAI